MTDTYYFDELAVVERTPIFTLSSIHPLTDLRNVITGTPTDTTSEYVLSSGDKIESAEFGRYIPGYSAQAGMGVRVVTAPTASQVLRWGLYDDDNGFFFEQDANGIYVGIRRDGTDTRIDQADWNIDPLDGTGNPGIEKGATTVGMTLDTELGNIYQLTYTWYGYGQIEWQVLDNRRTAATNRAQRTVPVHRLAPSSQTSVLNPNLPITVENTGAGDGVIALGGRQFSIIGQYVPERRTFQKVRGAVPVTTSWTPIIAFRRRPGDADAAKTKIRLAGVTSVVDATMQVAVVINPTITFGTAVDPDLDGNGESATEFSVNPSGFALGDGEPVFDKLVGSTGGGSNAFGAQDEVGLTIPITRERPAVAIARTLTGSGNIDLLLNVDEEW